MATGQIPVLNQRDVYHSAGKIQTVFKDLLNTAIRGGGHEGIVTEAC